MERLVPYGDDGLRVWRVLELQSLVGRQAGEIRNSGRVRQQVEDRDRVPCRRGIRDVLLDWIVEPQLPALFEQQDGRRCELLGNGAEAELRRGRVGNVPFEVCEPVSLAENDVAAAGDEHGSHEGLVADVGLDDLLHARSLLRKAGARDGQSHEGPENRFHAQEITSVSQIGTTSPIPSGASRDRRYRRACRQPSKGATLHRARSS